MKKIIRNNLFIGSIAITLGIILLILIVDDWIPENIILISGSMIAAGILFVIFSVLQLRGVIEIPDVSDERILKIRAHTFMKAYMFSFTVVCILGLLDFSGLLVMTSRSVIEIIFLTMGLSSFLLSWYYNRQGDICED
ncbi:MAG: hypothetical protein WAK10_01595 [Methanoregula sp.]